METFLSILQSISVIIASGVAIYGINAWRKEFRGKRQIELAEEVLALFYKTEDIISSIRSPMSASDEGTSRVQEDDETEEIKKKRDLAYSLIERYNRSIEHFSKLFSLEYRYKALFGSEKSRVFRDLRSIVSQMIVSAKRLYQLWPETLNDDYISDEKKERIFSSIRRHETTFWEGNSDDDPIREKLDKIIEIVEQTCDEANRGKTSRKRNT